MNAPPHNMFAPPVPHVAAPQVERHVCFSGAISCSGVEPCDACSQALKELIFKGALAHAVSAEQAALLEELRVAPQQRRPIDLQHLANVAFASFFAALASSWEQLHQHIDQEMLKPAEQRPFAARDMAMIMQSAAAYQAILRERAAAAHAANAANAAYPNGASSARNGVGASPAHAPHAPVVLGPVGLGAQPNVVFDPVPVVAPHVPPPAVVDFDRAMQGANVQASPHVSHAPQPPQPPQDPAQEPNASPSLNTAAAEPAKPSRRLTPDDFTLAAETQTHDEPGNTPGTKSSS